MTRWVCAGVALAALYLAVLGSLRLADVVTGGVVSAAVLAGCRRFLAQTGPDPAAVWPVRVHPLALPALGAATLAEIVRGTLDVVRAVLAPTPRAYPGVVEVPLPDASSAGLAALALALTLSPGSVLVDIDHRRRAMLVHVVDARDPDAIRARLLDFDQRWRRPAVE